MHTPFVQKDYLENYVQRLCSQEALTQDMDNHKLFCKAAGEFSLLCSVLKTKFCLTPSYESVCRQVAKVFGRKEFNPGIFPAYCILEYLGINVWKDQIASYVERLDRCRLPMETAFILGNFKNDLPVTYWEAASWEICKQASESGMDTKGFYIVTHLIMFATHMGSRKPEDVFSAKSIEVLHPMLTLIQANAYGSKNWDLLLEVFICRIYMNPRESNLWHQLNTEVYSMPSYRGLTLTYGADVPEFEKRLPGIPAHDTAPIDVRLQDPFNPASYHLFHTNLVRKLFELCATRATSPGVQFRVGKKDPKTNKINFGILKLAKFQ